MSKKIVAVLCIVAMTLGFANRNPNDPAWAVGPGRPETSAVTA